jgi:hypothetical protein
MNRFDGVNILDNRRYQQSFIDQTSYDEPSDIKRLPETAGFLEPIDEVVQLPYVFGLVDIQLKIHLKQRLSCSLGVSSRYS